jgi:hypothetical protein
VKRLTIVATALLLTATVANAATGDRCKVTDPTGTPLNVRSEPNGKIVGTLANGTLVSITEYKDDANGSPGSTSPTTRPRSDRLGVPRVRLLLLTVAEGEANSSGLWRDNPYIPVARLRPSRLARAFEPTVLDDILARP